MKGKETSTLPNPHLGICIPSNGMWTSGFGKSLALLMSKASMECLLTPGLQTVSILTSEGSVLSQLRHNMVKNALKAGCTHVLFIDSDQTFPADLAHRLIKHKKPIVAANCTTRAEPVAPVAIGMNHKRVLSIGKQGLEKVRQIGTGVMMIDIEIFKKLKPPFFLNEWSEIQQSYCGEDIYFCYKVKAELGINVFIDHEVSKEIKHIGQRHYGHEDIDPDHEVITRQHNPVDTYKKELVKAGEE